MNANLGELARTYLDSVLDRFWKDLQVENYAKMHAADRAMRPNYVIPRLIDPHLQQELLKLRTTK